MMCLQRRSAIRRPITRRPQEAFRKRTWNIVRCQMVVVACIQHVISYPVVKALSVVIEMRALKIGLQGCRGIDIVRPMIRHDTDRGIYAFSVLADFFFSVLGLRLLRGVRWRYRKFNMTHILRIIQNIAWGCSSPLVLLEMR